MKPFYELWVNVYDFKNVDFGAIVKMIPDMIICMILCCLAALINISGIETAAHLDKPLDLNAEFGALGAANVITGLLGGAVGHPVAAFTLPTKADGGVSRITPFTAAAFWLVCFFTGAPIMNYVPRFFVGGCFLQIGFGLARTFLWDSRAALDQFSLATAWCCVIFAFFLGLNSAAYFGLAVVLFSSIKTSLRQPIIRAVQRLDERGSSCYRSLEEMQLLKTHGHKIMVVALQGYLYWGCIAFLTTTLLDLVDGTEDDPDTIIIDVGAATGVDVSVVNAIKKMVRIGSSHNITLYVTGMDKLPLRYRSILQGLPFSRDKPLDDVLEEEENKLISQIQEARKTPGRVSVSTLGSNEDGGSVLDLIEETGGASDPHKMLEHCFERWFELVLTTRLQDKVDWEGFKTSLMKKGVSEVAIDAVIAAGHVRHSVKGQQLVEPAHPTHHHVENSMFLIISGEFGTSYGKEENVLFKGVCGSLCGEQDFFADHPPSCWITCLSDEGFALEVNSAAFELLQEDSLVSLDFVPFLLKESALNASVVRNCFR